MPTVSQRQRLSKTDAFHRIKEKSDRQRENHRATSRKETSQSLFGVFCFGYSLLIQQKTLGSLMSLSAALMLGAQFWMGRQGGVYMAWYLPLIILTIFRPNLSDRTATAAVVDLPGAEGTS